jgi:hypothetical protein
MKFIGLVIIFFLSCGFLYLVFTNLRIVGLIGLVVIAVWVWIDRKTIF